MTDTVTGTVYRPKEGYFVSDAGEQLTPGWRTVVGFKNFNKIFTDPNIREPFVRVFIWTFLFALLSVVITFTLGLLLAMVFNSPKMKLKPIYRSLVIIPYALPSFMTALVWKGMLNDSFGVVNRYLDTLFGVTVPWLSDPFWAKVSLLLVNLWLGFPYMFLICTGALQGIPTDLTEAARVDGATGAKAFRKVTFPLLLVAVSPLLISSFAFNFNNFNLVKLLTNGGPPFSGGSSAGHTDILISYTYNLAFGSARGADYGLASAVSVFIFIIVATISAVSFKFTRTFEEVK
jgi:arabinogalactan oligomer/maltooligosaccharide transport system permease protein